MGTWRIEAGLYGERERWVPDFLGEWPDVADQPCPVCMGELTRRAVQPTRGAQLLEYERAKQRHARAVKAGLNPEPLPPEPDVPWTWHYDRACYRGPHGLARQSGEHHHSGPVLVGSMPTLSRPIRTGDWGERE